MSLKNPLRCKQDIEDLIGIHEKPFIKESGKLYEIMKKSYPNYKGGKDTCGYMPLYDTHLPKSINNFLEIGIGMGDSINMFRDFYKGIGSFWAMNMNWDGAGVVEKSQLQRMGFNCLHGDQGDVNFLSTIETKFDVIVDDGSHHSDDQIVTFKQMFVNNLVSGGLYIIEDLHCCQEEYWWRDRLSDFGDTLLAILKRFPKTTFKQFIECDVREYRWIGSSMASRYFTEPDNKYFLNAIDKVYLYDPSIAFIWKK